MDSPTDPTQRFLTIEQVAEELNVGVPSIRALLKTGELRGIQVGGRGVWRVARQDVEDYIDAAYEKTSHQVQSRDLEDGLTPIEGSHEV
jgi:prophage regulatory protein